MVCDRDSCTDPWRDAVLCTSGILMAIRIAVEINSKSATPGDLKEAMEVLAVLFNHYHCDVGFCKEKPTAIIPLYTDPSKPAVGARLVCDKHINGF